MPSSSPRRRDSPLQYAGILLIFAPIGVLMMMVQNEPKGWAAGLVSGLIAGIFSVGWAYMFIREKWWMLVPLIALPVFLPDLVFRTLARVGFFNIGIGMSPQWRLIVLAVMCVAFTAAGFVLSVIHLRTTERRNARAHAELEIARRVHHALVPPVALRTALAEVYGRSVPSSAMGGDLMDVLEQDGSLTVLLGDVSGHGVAAGVVMAMLKGCIRTRLLRAAPLEQVITDANRVLADLTAPNMFATLAALRLSPGGRLEFALAGHLPVFHHSAGAGRWEQHPNQSLPLGIDHRERFVAGSIAAQPGDTLAVFTDGLVEVQNGAGRELGLAGVAALLAGSLADSLPEMHDRLMAAVRAHGPQIDDQSLVLVRVL